MQLSLISLALTRIYGGGATAFSPLSLFAGGEQGVWYDPSDLSTMFQDSAGTTPVTAAGQPVGLILDKSKGLVLGPELVTNGSFTTDTGWTKGAGVTISGGKANFAAATGYCIYNNAAGVAAGGYYEVTFTVSDYVSGTIRPYLGATATFGTAISANGTYTQRFGPLGGAEVGFNSASAFTGSIDNFSVKAVTGNHASQATAAKRPLLQNDGVNNYLAFDGVDDGLATASIDFTATDKMSVFSGVRKISDVATGVYFETSGDASVNAGAVRLSSPSTAAAATYGFTFRGTTSISQGSASPFSAPVTNVLTTIVDGAQSGLANQVKARVNGSLQVLSVGANGDTVGSMGNYVTYVGTRNGAWPLNGRIYSLIVLGRLATTQEITDTETWVAGKTGVTLP